MSTVAIDSASSRSTERLTVFLSEIAKNEPVDQVFVRRPAIQALMKNKKTIDGGRQYFVPANFGTNPTIQDFSDYDVFNITASDTHLPIVYPLVNKGGVLAISWEEEREVAGKDHATFNLLSAKRKILLESLMDLQATDLFASSQVASKISCLPVLVDATAGSPGGISNSTDADWAATETPSGSFAAQGLTDLRTLHNTLYLNGSMPDTHITTQAIYEFYENAIDPDVRYNTAQGVGGRKFKGLEFAGDSVIMDPKATSGVWYMIDSNSMYFVVDTEGNYTFDPFEKPATAKAKLSKLVFRGQLVMERRKSNGKLTNMVA